jgi:hypothetical protein
MSLKSFEGLNFDNSCLKRLPIDPETQNYVREVSHPCPLFGIAIVADWSSTG